MFGVLTLAWATAPVDLSGVRDIRVVLRHFERGGLLERLPTQGGRQPQLLQPAKSRFWTLCRGFLVDLLKP